MIVISGAKLRKDLQIDVVMCQDKNIYPRFSHIGYEAVHVK